MQVRKFGKKDFLVSALGFGCMRLPTDDNIPYSDKINEKESIRMIRTGIDRGINYIDTAYPYHGGKSEIVTGKALKEGYRQKVKLATKSPTWAINKPEDFDSLLDEQLKKLDTDFIDCYLLHALNESSWDNVIVKHDILTRAQKAKKEGKIGMIGFSFHDEFPAFKKIIDGFDSWDFCQIQYNYMDIDNQAGTKGLKYAAEKGIAVIIMEPLLGGRLANPPKSVMELFNSYPVKKSPAEWALQWIWNQPEVALILSGMSTMNQLEENLKSAEHSGVNLLSKEDLDLIDKVRARYNEKMPIPCTRCGYCMPCPNGVNIPWNFELYNNGVIHEDMKGSASSYKNFMSESERAAACIQCRICEEKCPQAIRISEWMPKVSSSFK